MDAPQVGVVVDEEDGLSQGIGHQTLRPAMCFSGWCSLRPERRTRREQTVQRKACLTPIRRYHHFLRVLRNSLPQASQIMTRVRLHQGAEPPLPLGRQSLSVASYEDMSPQSSTVVKLSRLAAHSCR